MLTLARAGRIDKPANGLCCFNYSLADKQRMTIFMAAGLRAVRVGRAT